MSDKFKSIKITNEIIIVEKLDYHYDFDKGKMCFGEFPQGYVVDPSNKQMLKNALSWAKLSVRRCDENGKSIYDERGNQIFDNIEGKEHRYINGNFDFEIFDNADNSSQGGKLSFWNCLLTAPDGKVFKIGINAELLLYIIRENTFINGKCQNKVWLGRVKGQVGAFTENMQLFAQAKREKAFEEQKPSTKYFPGDILRSKKYVSIYIGETTEYFSIQNLFYDDDTVKSVMPKDFCAVIDSKPVNYHAYIEFSINKDFDINNIDQYLEEHTYLKKNWYLKKEPKKISRVVVGHIELDKDYFDLNGDMLESKLYYHKFDLAQNYLNDYEKAKERRPGDPDAGEYELSRIEYNDFRIDETKFDIFVNDIHKKLSTSDFSYLINDLNLLKNCLSELDFPTIRKYTDRFYAYSFYGKVKEVLLEEEYIKHYNSMQSLQNIHYHKSSRAYNRCPLLLPSFREGRTYNKK